MFCPEDYVTLNEIFAALEEHAWSSLTPAENATLEPHAFDPPEDEVTSYKNWLICAFLTLYADQLRVALSSGHIVRTAPWVFDFEAVGEVHPDWQGLGHYPVFPKSRSQRLTIRPISMALVNDLSCTVDSTKTKDPVDQIALGPIHGLPVCIKLPNKIGGSDDWTQAWPHWIEASYRDASPSKLMRVGGGRPGKTGPLRTAYLSVYPEGHSGITKKQVLRRIQEEWGLAASSGTFDKMLKELRPEEKTPKNPPQ